jgi:hypothetical protein
MIMVAAVTPLPRQKAGVIQFFPRNKTAMIAVPGSIAANQAIDDADRSMFNQASGGALT